MDVSNTALILAVRLLDVNKLLCPEWEGEWHSATFSTARERESRPQQQFYVCSTFANHERITARTWITSSQFSVWVAAVPLPNGMLEAELNLSEKGTNQFMKWFYSLRSLKRFVRLNDTFATDTTLVQCLLLPGQILSSSNCKQCRRSNCAKKMPQREEIRRLIKKSSVKRKKWTEYWLAKVSFKWLGSYNVFV